MKQEVAVQHLRDMLFLIQKVRSNAQEWIDRDVNSRAEIAMTNDLLIDLTPWVFDDNKCPIPALIEILDNVDTTGILAPMDYFNMMTILYQFMPTLVAFVPMCNSILPAETPSLTTYIRNWE